MSHRIFVINTGSTSTKIGLYDGGESSYTKELTHSVQALKEFSSLSEQLPYRKTAIEAALQEDGVTLGALSAVAARGGTFGYAEGGAYLVEENLLEACRHPITNHPSNLSALLAYELAKQYGCQAYIYDAVCVNEVTELARVTGLHDVLRRPFSHVLNTRAMARAVAQEQGKRYEEMNFIVAHLGGGISINVHDHGKIVDLVCDDEGPMSPERAGRLNGKALIDLCYSGKYDKAAMMRRIKGAGGLVDHLGTADLRLIERKITEGDTHAAFVLGAMSYQIAKDIAALSAVVRGQVDVIILTGGGAHCRQLVRPIIDRVSYLAPVVLRPGAVEMEALRSGVARVLDGEEQAKIYRKDT
jgi:butyrate kinase